jgi:hypothetical protein
MTALRWFAQGKRGAVVLHNAQQPDFVERRHANTRKIGHLVAEQSSYIGCVKRGVFMHRIASALVLLFALVAQTARAFFDPPRITPAAPGAGEIVSVNIHGGICDAILEWPGYPQITQEGNAIRIIEYGYHVDFVDWCIYGVGTLTQPIGAFPPGDYTLTVDFFYDNYPYGYATITLGVIPFTVTGAAPAAPVPTTSPLGLIALLLFLPSLAVWILRTRKRSRD